MEVVFRGAATCNTSISTPRLALGNHSEVEIDVLHVAGPRNTYRSVARLALGNHSGALEDAAQALALNPLYPEAYICQGDAFLAMTQFDSAHNSYLTALQIDPSIRRSKSFKARIANLENLTAVNKP